MVVKSTTGYCEAKSAKLPYKWDKKGDYAGKMQVGISKSDMRSLTMRGKIGEKCKLDLVTVVQFEAALLADAAVKRQPWI